MQNFVARLPDVRESGIPESGEAEVHNVLFVNHSLGMGGIETMIRDFALDMKDSCFAPCVAVFAETGEIGAELVARGVLVVGLEKREGIDVRLVGRLRRIIQERQIDVVHSNNYSAWLYSVLAVIGTKAEVLHTEHSKVLGGWRRHLLERILARSTGAVVAVSAEVRRAMTEDIGIPEDRVCVIENGVDTEKFRPSPDGRNTWRRQSGIEDSVVVYGIVARLVPVKAHDVLLKSFYLVQKNRHSVKLVIAGDGPCRSALEEQCHQLGLDDAVVFLGEVQNPALFLSAIDVYVLSSRDEGMNLTLLEAMSSGLPVVATAVGGNPEVVQDGVTGVLVEADNHMALAEGLEQMVKRPEMRSRMGSAGRDRAAKCFSQAATIRAYMNLYARLTNKGCEVRN